MRSLNNPSPRGARAGASPGLAGALAVRREVKIERRATQRLALLCAGGLALAALLPPLGFIAFPAALRLIGSVPAAYGLVGILLALPALIGVDAARLGLNRVAYRLRGRPDKEHVVAISRVFVATVLFAYAMGLAQFGPFELAGANAGWCLSLAGAALAAAWGMLLHVMTRPAGSPVRRSLGLVFDAALLSGFLHFGDAAAAAAYPVYLLVICQAGFHLGGAALATAAGLSLAGFAGVVVTTEYWQQQPLLSFGLASALIIVAALVGLLLRLIEFFKRQAAAAESARSQWLRALSRVVRRPELPSARADRAQSEPASPAFLSEINDILDLSAIEAGEFTTQTETFDLHLLVNRVLAQLRPEAAAKGLRLSLRVDPRLPFQLRGARLPFARVLSSLAIHAIESGSPGAVRIAIDADRLQAHRVRLRISIRFEAPPTDIGSAAARFAADPFGDATDAGAEAQTRAGVALALATRLAELLGGEVIGDAAVSGIPRRLTALLPLAIEESAAEIGLDLAGRPVLIVTEDSHFAHDLAEPLTAWQADARWIGGFEAALTYLTRQEVAERAILLVDGRNQVLSALSFVNRAPPSCGTPPFVLFVADAAQVDGLATLADDEFDALVPAPVDDDLLGNALHALPLQGDRPPAIRRIVPEAAPAPFSPAPEERLRAAAPANPALSAEPDSRVTPISAHPRFAADAPDILDGAAIEALRGLDAGDEFLREVIGSFRIESHQILDRLRRAAAIGDIAAFARAAQALRSAAGIVGGARVCEMLATLRRISPDELRERGAAELHRLATELSWLDAALGALFGAAEAHQR